jgi:hypothetical protein
VPARVGGDGALECLLESDDGAPAARSSPSRSFLVGLEREAEHRPQLRLGLGGEVEQHGDRALEALLRWVVDPDARAAASAPRRVRAGRSIRVTWRNAPAFRRDWVGIWRAGDPRPLQRLPDLRLHGRDGRRGARRSRATPRTFPPGRYVVRLMHDDGYGELARASFRVVRR